MSSVALSIGESNVIVDWIMPLIVFTRVKFSWGTNCGKKALTVASRMPAPSARMADATNNSQTYS